MPPLDPAVLARHHRRNRLQTLLVLAGIGGAMALVGWLLGGVDGVLWTLAGTALLLFLQPVRSPLVLRAVFGAQPMSAADAPALARLVAGLAERAGLERVPPLLFIPRPEVVALSTGTGGDTVIAISGGLLASLPVRELAAVLAHEISHLRHGDLKVLRLAEAAGRLTRFFALFGVLSILFYLPAALVTGMAPSPLLVAALLVLPLMSDLLTLKLSRTREFDADAGSAELTGDPRALILALKRIERIQGSGWERLLRPPAWLSLIRTHPTTEERILRLEELGPPPDPPPAPPPVWGGLLPAELLPLPPGAPWGRRRWRGPWG